MHIAVIIRDHSFLRNVEFWAEPRKLPISSEFCRIRHWLVISEQIQHILIGFRWLYARFCHKIHNCRLGSNWRNIEQSLSDILLAYLVDRLYLIVVVAENLWNFANWPVEFGRICCGKLWSLVVMQQWLVALCWPSLRCLQCQMFLQCSVSQ